MEIVKRTLCMILTAALLACFPSAEAQALLAQWETEWNAFVDSFAGAG